jgi:uncharacterized damage-inducible protein DinB
MPTQTAAPAAPAIPAAPQLQAVKFARGGTKKLLEGIPADKLCVIPTGCSKHALWIAGHLACTDDWFVAEFGGGKAKIPEAWQKIFGMNSIANADSKSYPPIAEVMKALDASHAAVIKWVGSLSAEQLQKAMPKEWEAYAPTMANVPMFAAWHEGYHAGQLSAVRKGLGLPAAFG